MSTTSTATAPALAKDFPAWFPPTLVKELRQGLRTRVFVYFFVLTQAFMLLTLLLEATYPENKQSISNLIWGTLAFALVGLAPIRCLFAVSAEVSKNTIDLLLLTRQRSLQIVTGKWVANMALVGLALISILPYVVARHFLGAGDVINQLESLWHLFLASCVACAAGIALSAVPGQLLRWVVCLATLIVTSFFAIVIIDENSYNGTSGAGLISDMADDFIGKGWWAVPQQLLISVMVIWLFLEFGAGRIAPAGDSRSTRRRVLFVIGGSICFLIASFQGLKLPLAVLSGGLLVSLGCIDALTEGAPPRRPTKNRWGLGYFLDHGWQTGALYCCIISVIAAAITGISLHLHSEKSIAGIIPIMIGAQLIIPAFILRVFKRNSDPHTDTFQLYMLTNAILGLLAGVIAIAGEASGVAFNVIIIVFMPIAGMGELVDELNGYSSSSVGSLESIILVFYLATLALLTFGIMFLGRRFLARIRDKQPTTTDA